MAQPAFLIDSNCLINPHNDYYRPDFGLSQQFWVRLEQLVVSGEVGILSQVRLMMRSHVGCLSI
ncbi:DUF4411 family protein [Bifidobacterium panos]|uniref:DUF4411 family protein n=1 Tax=Bifidobacterium panos TaxID=2675321 RepID=A0ABX1SWX3_9BIFI|nr:DUF4411 family protein [Bifidobacterium sp. DSM 109963]NMN02343.1 hypothetical protein [Bifidobacterium sp. DSM 109963]